MLKLKQYFCKHNFAMIAEHRSSQQNLWKCKKCKVYYIQHYGINVGYKCEKPNLNGWVRVYS